MPKKAKDPRALLKEGLEFYSDRELLRSQIEALVWPDCKPFCPDCESENVRRLAKNFLYRCKDCRMLFDPTEGSMLVKSGVSAKAWFAAIHVEGNWPGVCSAADLVAVLRIDQHWAKKILRILRKAAAA